MRGPLSARKPRPGIRELSNWQGSSTSRFAALKRNRAVCGFVGQAPPHLRGPGAFRRALLWSRRTPQAKHQVRLAIPELSLACSGAVTGPQPVIFGPSVLLFVSAPFRPPEHAATTTAKQRASIRKQRADRPRCRAGLDTRSAAGFLTESAGALDVCPVLALQLTPQT